jgi:hypothetical protein
MKGLSKRSLIATVVSISLLLPGMSAPGSDWATTDARASTIGMCSGNSFWAGLIGSSGASGNTFYTVALINEGRAACRLAGYPVIHGSKDNRVITISTTHLNSSGFGISATILASRTSGELILTTDDVCDALISGGQARIKKAMSANTYTDISIMFPKSKAQVYVPGLVLDVACGLDTTELGWDRAST